MTGIAPTTNIQRYGTMIFLLWLFMPTAVRASNNIATVYSVESPDTIRVDTVTETNPPSTDLPNDISQKPGLMTDAPHSTLELQLPWPFRWFLPDTRTTFRLTLPDPFLNITPYWQVPVASSVDPVEQTNTSPSFMRASSTLALSLGVGAGWYWGNTDLNSADWDFQWGWQEQFQRHHRFQGWRFDDNELWLNSPGHPLAGAGFYLIGRMNNYSQRDSFLTAIMGSMIWELLIEYKEVVSLNDLIFTTIAAIPLGEAYYQVAHSLRNASTTSIIGRGLCWVLGAPLHLNDYLNGQSGSNCALGSRNISTWTTNVLGTGLPLSNSGDNADGLHATSLYFDSEIITTPNYGKPGHASQWSYGPLISRFYASGGWSSNAMSEFTLDARTLLFGYSSQNIQSAPSGLYKGYNLIIGSPVAFRHGGLDYGEIYDRHGIVHLPGLSIEIAIFSRQGNRFRLGIDTHPDFAAITSLAFPLYDTSHTINDTKSVLANQGYYYGTGYSGILRLDANWGPVSIRHIYHAHRSYSIQGRDRFQHEIIDDLLISDALFKSRRMITLDLPWYNLRLGLERLVAFRDGEIFPVSTQNSARRWTVRLGINY